MILRLHVDTNDYDGRDYVTIPMFQDKQDKAWSLFRLNLATFQDWRTVGQTGYWTIDGEAYCGTAYECEINYRDELLLRCLVSKIKESCGDRYINLWIDGLSATFTDDDLLEMNPLWISSMKST